MTSRDATGARWTMRDVIDFEHLLQAGEDGDAEWIAGPARPRGFSDRRAVLHEWLDFMRARGRAALPGDVYARGRRVVKAVAVGAGLLVGIGLCGSVLSRSGIEPINALLFFGITVGMQLALLAVVTAAWLLRGTSLRPGLVRDAVLAVVTTVGRALQRLDGQRRTALQARLASLDFRSERLAPLVGCDLLIVTQWFAIAFNVGLLGALLLVYLPFVELRFGWQTTYPFVASQIDVAVQAVASPWSWISDTLRPDTGEIVATRYTRGQAAETLPVAAAMAWWPFLVASIVVYGLLLRIALAAAATATLGRRLARLDFRDPATNALWRRIEGPLVTAEVSDVVLSDRSSVPEARHAAGVDLLIVDDELAATIDRVEAAAARSFGGPLRRVARANIDDDVLEADLLPPLTPEAIVVIATSASRDPIVAIAGFLRAVAAVVPRQADVALLLVGEPNDDGFADVVDERLTIWKRFATIQRLSIGVERAT